MSTPKEFWVSKQRLESFVERGVAGDGHIDFQKPTKEYEKYWVHVIEKTEYDRIKKLLNEDKAACMKRIDELTEQLAAAQQAVTEKSNEPKQK